MKLIQQSALPVTMAEQGLQFVHTIGAEFGTEILLFSLFLIGFGLFRVTAVRKALDGRWRQQKPKAKSVETKNIAANDVVSEVRGIFAAKKGADTVVEQSSEPRSSPAKVQQPSQAVTAKNPSKERVQLLCRHAAAGSPRALEFFEHLVSQVDFNFTESGLASVVSACADSRHVQLAERCTAYARELYGTLTLEICTSLMRVYTHARLFEKTCELYDAMRRDGVKPDNVAYGSLIRASVESGRLDLARRLFQESGNPDRLNYMSLIRAAGREKDVPKALKLLSELEELPRTVDASAYNWAYNCTLEVCAVAGESTEAFKLLKRMEENDCADVVSYNTYLKILLSQGLHDEVAAVLENMKSRGVAPSVVTYNSLVKSAVARQDPAAARQLIAEMEKKGVRPDSFTCSILLKSTKQSTQACDVDEILQLINRAKIAPDEVLVTCLLEACVRLGDADRIAHVLDRFKSTGVIPSQRACAMLIKAYGHARRSERVWAVWSEVLGRGTIDNLSEELFANMVEACVLCGDLDGVAAVLREALPAMEGFTRAAAVFAAVVKACVQSRRAQLGVELYHEVKENITCTKVTYNTLIDALVRQNDLAGATELFRDMGLEGVGPDLITYSTLIKGHCLGGDLEQGLQLLGLMQRRGIAPDAILFNSILDGCAHKQMRALTETVLSDMEKAGVVPSNHTISILVKLYGRCGDLPAAFNAVEVYPKTFGFKLNAQVYTCLMSACIANGSMPQALASYDAMIAAGCLADAKTYQTLLKGCVRHVDVEGADRLLEDIFRQGNVTATFSTSQDRQMVEGVLLMAVRQGRTADIAMPMLQRLQDARINVSDRVCTTVRGR